MLRLRKSRKFWKFVVTVLLCQWLSVGRYVNITDLLQDLSLDEISAAIPLLNALSHLNQELSVGDVDSIWEALANPDLGIERLEEANKSRVCVSAL